ncbi:MAG: insulinase family protein [Alphaproteobacteria bacterium]|nr:insulinase family protein [Alphaproteobacteria bacterium]
MKYNPTLHRLSNGVAVILDPMEVETASVAVSFKTGSWDEKPNEYGITHFCEHMLCKGTTRFPTRTAIQDFLDEHAGMTNATTSPTELRLHGRIIGENLDKLIDVLSDQLQNSLFLPERIELERLVILDELRRSQDNRPGPAFVWQTLFNQSVSNRTLGPADNIKSFSREQMLDWLGQRLSAKNCTIAISGKISDPSSVLDLLEQKFNFLPTHDVSHLAEPTYHPVNAHDSSRKTRNVNLLVAIPKRFKMDNSMLFERACERRFKICLEKELFEEVRQKHGLVYGISVGAIGQNNGVHTIETECSPENIARVTELIAQTCNRVYNSGVPTDEWLQRYVNSCKLGDADWLDAPQKRLDSLVNHFSKNNKLYDFFNDVKLTDSITAKDVQKYSRGFFDQPMSIVTAGPAYDANLAQIWKQNFPESNITPFSDITEIIKDKNQGR